MNVTGIALYRNSSLITEIFFFHSEKNTLLKDISGLLT
jgi:hypothetical protein